MGDDLRGRVETLVDTVQGVLPSGLFAAAQGMSDSDHDIARRGYGLIWCSAAVKFIERFPHLPQSQDEQYPDEINCIDLVMDLDPTGIVTRVELEKLTVAETLDELGEQQFPAVIGLDARDAGPVLAAQFEAIFRPR